MIPAPLIVLTSTVRCGGCNSIMMSFYTTREDNGSEWGWEWQCERSGCEMRGRGLRLRAAVAGSAETVEEDGQ